MAATGSDLLPRIEIVGDRRRVHDAALREQVVVDALRPGARVQDVAERHGICPSLVYRWRRAAAEGSPALRLLPVRITDEPAPVGQDAPVPPRPSGLIEIELAEGVRLRVDEAVSPAAVSRVLSVLRR